MEDKPDRKAFYLFHIVESFFVWMHEVLKKIHALLFSSFLIQPFQDFKNKIFGAAQHSGSIDASRPADSGSNLNAPDFFSDEFLSAVLQGTKVLLTKSERLLNFSNNSSSYQTHFSVLD